MRKTAALNSLQVTALAIAIALAPVDAHSEEPEASSAIVTRDEVFYIPFSADGDLLAQSLSLFVSGDNGRSWQFYQRQPASAGRFSFRAGVDGEFWFAVRPSRESESGEDESFKPELRVRVDRKPPAIALVAERTSAGEIVCRWSVDDADVMIDAVTIESRAHGDTTWSPAVLNPNASSSATSVAGVARIEASSNAVIEVRATARDQAGNVGSTTQSYDTSTLVVIDAPPSPMTVAALPLQQENLNQPMTQQPALSDMAPPAMVQPSNETARTPDSFPVAGAPQSALPTPPASAAPSASPTKHMFGSVVPDDAVPLTSELLAQRGSPPNLAQSGAGEIHGWQANNRKVTNPSARSNLHPSAPDLQTRSATPPASPRNLAPPAEQQPPPQSNGNLLADLPMPSVEAAETNPLVANYPSTAMPHLVSETSHRVSNSRRFELEYDIDSTSADQLHRIEVWYTMDGGRSWRHHGDDPDLVSPYLMDVPQDGLVGVRLLVQTRAGFTIQPPGSGDPADVWIRVDATKPKGRITAVKYGTGANAGALELYWEARDDNLGENPILFLYSDRPAGPWRKVADALPNTGSYLWFTDDRVPAKIFLKLEISDRAGNLVEETLPAPINNQRVAPRGMIRGVRPAMRSSVPLAR